MATMNTCNRIYSIQMTIQTNYFYNVLVTLVTCYLNMNCFTMTDQVTHGCNTMTTMVTCNFDMYSIIMTVQSTYNYNVVSCGYIDYMWS